METEGLIGPSLGPMKDIQNESTCDNLDNCAETNIPSFSNTSSYVVMPLQIPTNGAYHPISTACHAAVASASVSYSAPYGTVGVPITPWGSARTHEQQAVLSTNCFHSTGPEMKGKNKRQITLPPPLLLFSVIIFLGSYLDNFISFCRSSIYYPWKWIKPVDFL